ncbi:hypothetical protein ACEWY4_014813 [Coilia grayii]|uniref:5-hydroxytryptamine receptor 3A-like n=1 Tax=Coilia grayii TaxID=363190 RepID=A0ABD1JTJ1_9TELE
MVYGFVIQGKAQNIDVLKTFMIFIKHQQESRQAVSNLYIASDFAAMFLGSGMTLNCSQPTTKALLDAFSKDMFNFSTMRPVNSLNTPTNVSIHFTLYGILDVDEKAQILDTLIWLTMKWQIEFLSWDPVECGTSSITLPRKMFWLPDVIIDEFVDENNAPETFYVSVSHTGEVADSMPVEVVSSCTLDIYEFPFDSQNCSYTFRSWIHNADEIQLSFGEHVEDMLNMSKNVMVTKGEWELQDMGAFEHASANTGEITRYQLTYSIVLRRQSTMYVVNLLLPSFFLMTVDLVSFVLPPQNVDRSAFKMTLILGYTVFLLLMNELLPVTGNTIPLINVFFSLCLALMVGSLLETILITNMMCGSIRDLPLPNWLRVLFLKYFALLVCMGKMNSNSTSSQNQESCGQEPPVSCKGGHLGTREAEDSPTTDPSLMELKRLGEELQAIQTHLEKPDTVDQNAEDWMHIGLVIDRFIFWGYIFFYTISLVTILVKWTTIYSGAHHDEDH